MSTVIIMGNASFKKDSRRIHVQENATGANSASVKVDSNCKSKEELPLASNKPILPSILLAGADSTEMATKKLSLHSLGRSVSDLHMGSPCCCNAGGHTHPRNDAASNINGFVAQTGKEPMQVTMNNGYVRDTQSMEKAASQCNVLLMQLNRGLTPDHTQLKNTLSYVTEVLYALSAEPQRNGSTSSLGCGQLDDLVEEDEVRAWLTTTFTHSDSRSDELSNSKPSFRAVVDTILVGQYFKKIYDTPINYPDEVTSFFETQRDHWDCNVFQLDSLTSGQPLKYLGHELFRCYGLISEYKISHSTLNTFLECIEEGYKRHCNPYHNSIHAADVTQTMHYFIQSTGLQDWLSPLEILAMIFSALIHDLEHTGTTNGFHVRSGSDLALCYNDISVLENYHISRAFCILTEDSHNILKNMEHEDYVKLRSLVVEMVLATDMSNHFAHLKHLKKVLSSPDNWQQIQSDEKPKVLSLFLHMADISHPGKSWALHEDWTSRLIEEFFRQGDREKEMGLPCSPLCDRNATLIPESQIGFIDVIVAPAYQICGEIMETIVKELAKTKKENHGDEKEAITDGNGLRVWLEHITTNKLNWKQQCKHKNDEIAIT